VRTRPVQFTHGGTTINGIIAWDDAVTGRRPGLLIIHGGWGYTDNVREQAKRIAESGYVGYAFDMHGMGAVATHQTHGSAAGRQLDDSPAFMATRFFLAMDQLKADPHVDPQRISALGYCWGGAVVLNMARAGANLDVVVTIAGILDTTTPAQKNQVGSKILILTGELDPLVPPAKRETFRKEMSEAGARFEIVVYPGAKHAFTQPYAREAKMDGLDYDPAADKASWAALLKLLQEVYR
jgi:dienelactone hydrolase